MSIFLYVIIVLLGIEIGSFLNVCIDRLPWGRSIASPPSHCDSCGTRLKVRDLVPIFSYLLARGRCRYCGSRVPRRVLAMEIITGALFGFLLWRYGLTPDFGIAVFYSCVFLVLLMIDLEHKLILSIIVYPMMLIALLVSTLYPPDWYNTLFTNGHPGFLLSSLIGGVSAFILFLIIVIVSRGGMGFGDVNMAGMIGFILGFPLVFNAILLAIFGGGLFAIVLLALRLKGRKEGIPFGPFLALGAMATIYYGPTIFGWYIHLFTH